MRRMGEAGADIVAVDASARRDDPEPGGWRSNGAAMGRGLQRADRTLPAAVFSRPGRVALLDRVLDPRPRFGRGEAHIALDRCGLPRQLLVLDALLEPARV